MADDHQQADDDEGYDQNVAALVNAWIAWKRAPAAEKDTCMEGLKQRMLTLATGISRVANFVLDLAENAPMGCSVAARAMSSLLMALRDKQENKELVMLLAVEVALIWELFRGITSATGADRDFYVNAAGRLHTAVLQSVSYHKY